jgi:hypothetical protein
VQVKNAKPLPLSEYEMSQDPSQLLLPPTCEVTTYEELFEQQKAFHQEVFEAEQKLSGERSQVDIIEVHMS